MIANAKWNKTPWRQQHRATKSDNNNPPVQIVIYMWHLARRKGKRLWRNRSKQLFSFFVAFNAGAHKLTLELLRTGSGRSMHHIKCKRIQMKAAAFYLQNEAKIIIWKKWSLCAQYREPLTIVAVLLLITISRCIHILSIHLKARMLHNYFCAASPHYRCCCCCCGFVWLVHCAPAYASTYCESPKCCGMAQKMHRIRMRYAHNFNWLCV